MTTVEVLKAARALIDTPEKWTKKYEARDANGFAVRADDQRAVCWCINGAIEASLPRESYGPIVDACQAVAAVTGVTYVHQFNDRPGTTHADVLAAFDRAIAAEVSS